MSGGLFDYIQNQTFTKPPELPLESCSRTPLEITQAEQQQALERSREVYKAYQDNAHFGAKSQRNCNREKTWQFSF